MKTQSAVQGFLKSVVYSKYKYQLYSKATNTKIYYSATWWISLDTCSNDPLIKVADKHPAAEYHKYIYFNTFNV